ncbi:DUF2059 domain-containing protein [Phenylobacterium sp.]|jgi:hypothetical protein|uniref:DUF2059 domain-containing protein n=1 Tax=Phenylobacterium sp. TaxID=1871053 RepID=UPI002F947FA0
MFLKSLTAAAVALSLLAGPAAAQQPSAAQMTLVRRYMAAIDMPSMMKAMMESMTPAMLQDMEKRLGQSLPSDVRDALVTSTTEAVVAMTPRMMDAMAPVLASGFTEAELRAAVAYMESPEGRSFMAKSPAMMSKAMPAMQPLIPEMQADMQARFCRKVDCSKLGLK